MGRHPSGNKKGWGTEPSSQEHVDYIIGTRGVEKGLREKTEQKVKDVPPMM